MMVQVLLVFWVMSLILQMTLSILAVLHEVQGAAPYEAENACLDAIPDVRPVRLWSLVLSTMVSLPPVAALAMVFHVFVIGGSSNVAQFAVDTRDLWSLWVHSFIPLFFSNLCAFPVLLVAACLPPYPPGHWASSASRVCAVANVTFACMTLFCIPPMA